MNDAFDPKPSWYERLARLWRKPNPEDTLGEAIAEIIEERADDAGGEAINADERLLIANVLKLRAVTVHDIMVPRAQMDVVDISKPIDEWMPEVLETAHSRFPAVDGERDKVVGILLAKDLLRYYAEESFDVRDMLRPVVYIPESKRLNILLRD